MDQKTCPKCGGSLDPGRLANASQGVDCLWFAGESPLSFNVWTGQVIPMDRQRATVLGYRCQECGFVEFYAPALTQ